MLLHAGVIYKPPLSWLLLITTDHYFNLIGGGVPGGVVVGELLLSRGDVLCRGGIQVKQRSLGLGP